MSDYILIDSGRGEKLEQFGSYRLIRPCPLALWDRKYPQKWDMASASFSRDQENRWSVRTPIPDKWSVTLEGVKLNLSITEFGHLGVFPEHAALWKWMKEQFKSRKESSFLNLFAYSGGASLAAAQMGAKVCHVDASKGMVEWARENAKINDLENAPIRWIVDDALKFLAREIRRGNRYDAILLDPPTFGRGANGEVFKIERDLPILLERCKELLSDKPLFIIISCHTAGFTTRILRYLVEPLFPSARIHDGELLLEGSSTLSIPSGVFLKVLL